MKTIDVANTLVKLCREGRNHDAIRTLYATDVVSVEAGAPAAGESAESVGLEAVLAKGQWWVDTHETHSATVTGPFPNGNQFIVGFDFDVTHKPSGKRFRMQEMALYTVRNGKIAHEAFFYAM